MIGSQFVSSIHADSFGWVHDAELVGVMSPTPGHAESFAEKFRIPNHFTELGDLLAMRDTETVWNQVSAKDWWQTHLPETALHAGSTTLDVVSPDPSSTS